MSEPLRFCMLTTFFPPSNFGGDGIGVQRLARALARRGHHVTVIHDVDAFDVLHRGPRPAAPPDEDGIEVIRLHSGLGALSPLLTQQLGRPVAHGARIRRILEEGDYDVTMFHNVSLVGGPGLLRYGTGVRLYEAHEHWLVCPTHVLWRHGREACPGRECLRCTLAHHRPPQLWRYTGALERELRHVDAFIAKSEFSRLKHREFGFPRDMEVIPYFLPEEEPTVPGRAHAEARRPYFLFVGRLEKIKGLDDVIPAMARYPQADLLIAGEGEHGDVLRAQAAGIDNVRFLGRVAPEALGAFYRDAIALIVPSVCFETFGLILIESFRQGTPVLARRIGPFPEIVETAGGGLLFDGADDLLRAMQTMQEQPDTRGRMARAARAAFLDHWSERAVLPRYLDLIHELRERRSPGRPVVTPEKETVA